VGRVRTCRLGRRQLEQEMAWLAKYQALWAARFNALDELVQEMT